MKRWNHRAIFILPEGLHFTQLMTRQVEKGFYKAISLGRLENWHGVGFCRPVIIDHHGMDFVFGSMLHDLRKLVDQSIILKRELDLARAETKPKARRK